MTNFKENIEDRLFWERVKGVGVDVLVSEIEECGESGLYGAVVGLIGVGSNGSEYGGIVRMAIENIADVSGQVAMGVRVVSDRDHVKLENGNGKCLVAMRGVRDDEAGQVGVRFVWQKGGGVLAYGDVLSNGGGAAESLAYFVTQASWGMLTRGHDLTTRSPIVDEFEGFFS